MTLAGKRILLGVTGGIGAYKAASLVRELRKRGAEVAVVMTEAATRFITPLTLETLSGKPVATDMFGPAGERGIPHIERARWAQLLLIAPATANYIAKAAGGVADDLLSTITLAARCPLLLAPAMNTAMWEHAAVRANLATLRSRGVAVIEPGAGELACGEEGAGRLAEISDIVAAVESRLGGAGDLAGLRVLVTAGPTREPLDPVRYLTNRSSGKMGYALAEAALARGASVDLVSGPVAIEPPPGARLVGVETAAEMAEAVVAALPPCDWLVMTAAVADFRAAEPSPRKIKRGQGDLSLALAPNPDVLGAAGASKGRRLFIGFAAETEDLLANARKKLAAKGLDLVVANDVSLPGTGFDSDDNQAVILTRAGAETALPRMPKSEMAHRILDHALAAWKERPSLG